MYLRELYIKNSGPIEKLHLNLTFSEAGLPIPHVVVGLNGTGKTNLLSLIADALMEGASNAFHDVLESSTAGRHYFRVVGGKTLRYGETSAFTIIRFRHNDTDLFYHENQGNVTAEDARSAIPPTLHSGATWSGIKPSKGFNLEND
ncbi:MAG: hypothetical protein SW019_24125, partial [Actinomycetota bacterium]|nr:hypothetical protein [Actinomycetota bacterium]